MFQLPNLPSTYHVISPAVVEVLLLVVVPLPVLLVLLRRHRRHGVRELLRAGVERQLKMGWYVIICDIVIS